MLIFLQRMELLLKLTPAAEVQQEVLPILYRGIDCDTPQIHEMCLNILPTFAGLLNHANVKNSVLPKIKKLCLSTSTLSVRVNCLLCIGRILDQLDKWLVLDEILPFLPQIPSREPAVLMGIIGIYKLALNHKKLGISKEIIASRILPFLIPLCIENGLTLTQFNALVSLVKQMFQLVETEHRTKLTQLNSVQEQQKALESAMPTMSVKTISPAELETAFLGLGLDSAISDHNSDNKPTTPKCTIQTTPVNPTLKYAPTKDLTSMLLQNEISPTVQSVPANIPIKNELTKDLTSTILSNQVSHTGNTFPFQSPSNYVMLPTNVVGTSKGKSQPTNTQTYPNNNIITSSINNWPIGNNNFAPTAGNSEYIKNNWSRNNTSQVFMQATQTKINPWSNSSNPSSKENWSALDSLLPSAPNKIPMNQMQTQPLLMPSVNNNSNVRANALSEQDIKDFLS